MPALFLAEKDLDRHSLEVPSFADLILQKTAVPLFDVLRQVDENANDGVGDANCVTYLIRIYFPLVDGGGVSSIIGSKYSFSAEVGILRIRE